MNARVSFREQAHRQAPEEPIASALEMSEEEQIAFDREYVARFGLHGFVELAWSHVEPAAHFEDNWHLQLVANNLEAVSWGLQRDLVINVPPGTGKSLLTCVFWPAWTWIEQPGKKWIFASYAPGLSARDARRCRDLIQSDWFQKRWPQVQLLGHAETLYDTSAGGFRFSTSVRGEVTGRHADIIVCDDPIKPKDTQGTASVTKNELEFVKTWWGGTMSTRRADPKTTARVIIMQRLHQEDLAGHVLAQGGYAHVCLPMRFDPERACVTPFGADPRTRAGELLHPNRIDEAAVKSLEAELNVYAPAQLQQRPAREGGAIFRKAWFKFWNHATRPAVFDELVCSWDMTFKDTLGSDYVCGQVWGRVGADYYLLDRIYERLSFPSTLLAVKSQLRKWPDIGPKLIEDKANGPAVISVLERKVPGLIARTPEGSKVTRANAVSYLHRSGNVWYPDPEMGPEWAWVREHISQMTDFPVASHDDSVDAETQVLLYFVEQHNELLDALDRLVKEKNRGRS